MESQEALQAIAERNRRVEAEKAWETSGTRRLCIALLTYCTASIFLYSIGVWPFYVHALVPTGGYLLSTLSFPWVKRWWMQHYQNIQKR